MKKLYRVGWQGTCYVMAESEKDAQSVAMNALLSCDGDGCGVEAWADIETGEYGLDRGWKGAIPFNSDDERTVDELFAELKEGAKQYQSDLEREADVALAEEVFGCLVSDSNRVHLDDDVAIGMLEDGDRIHVFVGGVGNAIIGADWKRQDVIDFIRANHAELSGPGATAIGHGIASGDGRKWTFFKTKEMSE